MAADRTTPTGDHGRDRRLFRLMNAQGATGRGMGGVSATPAVSGGGFAARVLAARGASLRAEGVATLQVNLGARCNLACTHCHVSAGPGRTETMGAETAAAVLRALVAGGIPALDLTGGAPELNPHFRGLVAGARAAGRRVIVRSNLSVFSEPGMADLPEFLSGQGAEVIASLPCYLEENVDAVRGGGTYARCVEALRRLNALGYGLPGGPALGLVYNPRGPSLPPSQGALEADYRRELRARFGVEFSRLYAFANMPLGRFREHLARTGGLEAYRERLAAAFNPAALAGLMCRSLVSVSWDGSLHDCDFNQALGLPLAKGLPRRIGEFDRAALSRREIAVGEHCFGCTAGQGSSCFGAVA
jgi:radical SAM/Cys-rich protein